MVASAVFLYNYDVFYSVHVPYVIALFSISRVMSGIKDKTKSDYLKLLKAWNWTTLICEILLLFRIVTS